ncbi:auxin efflux carrier [Exidia glandulosa HHB12029]|uniref:Auxin efflux carrier n=1 Tax=Exidia glandulosa HHB12029 TaxID=1314781 RepID=A0A165LPK7_EXIGL|nr:auxin efflux carrier [Exidia glandulosa HHB12029]
MAAVAVALVDNTIVALVKTVFASILEVFIICLAGFLLATRGTLDPQTRKQLNRVNVSLFTPSLLFSKVAFFLSPAKLKELWIVPVIFAVVTVTSMVVGWVLSYVFRLKKTQRNFAIAAAMFMNTNSLPIALMQSLVVTVPGLKWDEDDNKNAMVGRALTYLVLHSTLGMILRWSFGVTLLAAADPEASDEAPPPEPEQPRMLTMGPAESAAPGGAPASATVPVKPRAPERRATSASVIGRNPGFFYSFPYIQQDTPVASRITLVNEMSDEDADHEQSEVEDDLPQPNGRKSTTEPSTSVWHSRLRRARRRAALFLHDLNEFMTAPLWAAIMSLVVACIPPVQHALDMHMRPVKGAISSAGNCSIPVTLVVLGAYFWREDPAKKKSKKGKKKGMKQMVKDWWNAPKGPSPPPGETRTVLVSILARMVVTPVVLLPLIYLFAKFDLHEMFDDPVFVVSTVLVVSSPPAITLAQMTQQASGDAFERLISRTIFWAYAVCTPPLTILYVVLGLYLSRQ